MSSTASIGLLFDLAITQGFLGTVKPRFSFSQALAAGNAADWQINKVFIQERTVVTGTPDTLNLSDGSLKDLFGNPLVYTKVIMWGIINEDLTNGLTVGAAAVHPWEGWISAGGTKKVPKGSPFIDGSKSGYAVGAGATDQLKIVADAGTIVYAIALLGQG